MRRIQTMILAFFIGLSGCAPDHRPAYQVQPQKVSTPSPATDSNCSSVLSGIATDTSQGGADGPNQHLRRMRISLSQDGNYTLFIEEFRSGSTVPPGHSIHDRWSVDEAGVVLFAGRQILGRLMYAAGRYLYGLALNFGLKLFSNQPPESIFFEVTYCHGAKPAQPVPETSPNQFQH